MRIFDMKRYLLLALLLPLTCLAQSPGVPLTTLPSVAPLGPELLFAWQPGTGGSGATACVLGWCPVTITPNALKTFIGGGGGGGSGTVTSIGLNGAGGLTFSGGPITTSGTFSAAWTGNTGGIYYFNGTNLVSSNALSSNAIVLGNGSGNAPFSLGSLGTTTTVLHGNASGGPSFGAVNYASDGTGIGSPANGFTGVNNGSNSLTLHQPSVFTSATGNIGTLEVQQNIVSGNYAFAVSDNGEQDYHTGGSAAAWTGPTNSVDSLPIGAVVTALNAPTAGSITITPGDTLYVAGTSISACPSGCTGTTLTVPGSPASGMLTMLKTGATQWSVVSSGSASGNQTLMQSGIPFILSSSGSVGNNCAITGLTAMQTTYASAYIWMPASAVASGVAAGWYYYVASSATAGTCYSNTYTSGQPEIPASPTAFSTTGPGAFTQTTGTQIIGPTVSVPAGSMGVNGELTFDGDATVPATANTKIVNYTFGGASHGVSAFNTNATSAFGWLLRIRNRGVATAQMVNAPNNNGEPGSGTSGPNFIAINTSSAQNLSYNLQLSVATDYIVLESYSVKEFPNN